MPVTAHSPEAPIVLLGGHVALRGRHALNAAWRMALMTGFAILFLPLPDLDQRLMALLHHRSILTHSILPALVLALLGGRLGAAPVAGAFIGLSVHLACDALSPPVGYGQIWLPAPWKIPLGDWSQPWLLAHAALSYLMALSIARFTLPKGWGMPFVILLSGILGLHYGLTNEQALSSVLIAVALPCLNAGLVIWLRHRHRARLRGLRR